MSDRHRRHRSRREHDREPRSAAGGVDVDWVHDKYSDRTPKHRERARGRSRSPARERVSTDSYRPQYWSLTLPPPPPAPPARVEDGYRTIEALMEKKAIQNNIRQPFFRFLNEARHKAIAKHKNCDPEARAYLADTDTWRKFWPNQDFPTSGPRLRYGGHTEECAADVPALLGNSSSTSSVAHRSPQVPRPIIADRTHQLSGMVIGEQKPPRADPNLLSKIFTNLNVRSIPTQPTVSLHQAIPSASQLYALIDAQNLHNSQENIIMVDTHPIFFPEIGFVKATFMSFQSETPDALAQVCYDLRCHIYHHKVTTGDLLLWAKPRISGDDRAFTAGHTFLEGWLTRIQRFGQVKPSVYWSEIQAGNIPRLFNGLSNTSSQHGIQIGKLARLSPIPFQNETQAGNFSFLSNIPPQRGSQHQLAIPQPKQLQEASSPISSTVLVQPQCGVDHWAEYKTEFKPSEFDMLLIEEKAKAEGMLRMVLDEGTGEIVTLRELMARFVRRSSVPSAGQQLLDFMARSNTPRAGQPPLDQIIKGEENKMDKQMSL